MAVKVKLPNGKDEPHMLDSVALLEDLPEHGLVHGQVGTIVEALEGAYEVEFADTQGRAYAEVALRKQQFLVLRHEPIQAA
ncbi:DUF4926 domain-containing protein [Flagellatimonas centrodinii]|uniref:DUF4926 domain-containing protein n=1 Tax=Flagellatimonas centrodinii TaxID=2806210 RepID=UPI001FF00A4E|nr:DUF4926 domain-containing protein [Flagellatimonas centrodinii]ULQ46909.1 DUF4926 domain-containing protein [Flagellatimonas centrodinii]